MQTACSFVLLDSLGVLRASGPDVDAFLQGQLSSDLTLLGRDRSLLAGYHNPQGRVIALATEDDHQVQGFVKDVISIPPAAELLLPLLEIVPLQLLAYHFGLVHGRDVDNPRNLVKAVVRE